MTALLDVDGIGKSFGGLTALRDVAFQVPQGAIMGIIGPNGAGKTTLFNCISGLMKPDAGRVRFGGREIQGLRPHRICRLGLARTFQIVRPFRGMSVLENVKVAAFARHDRGPAAEAHARAVLADLGMAHMAATDAGILGVAELRRLEIARALATDPQVLLLDEMLAGLTATEAAALCDQIRALRDRGLTILLVEHSVPVVSALCDRAVVLNFGEVLTEGPTAAVLADGRVQDAYLGSAAPCPT
ncbi:MAG: ABC transporter ATP-binding protein [Alphaproteobacteria bacterium]|jgi:branched-chain amino acid transport system ATP-binding protein|nr:ABC transporter ATP-binding protein [Alphaproteobacteria bacterium]